MNGYYNNDRNRGYNRRYNDGYRDDRQVDCGFQINQPVRHIATGTKLIVIRIGREQIECRKPDLSADWFYTYELEPFGDNEEVQ